MIFEQPLFTLVKHGAGKGGGGGGGGTFHFYDVKNCSFKRKYQIDIGTVRNKFSSRDTIMWVKVCIIVNKNVCKISVYIHFRW